MLIAAEFYLPGLRHVVNAGLKDRGIANLELMRMMRRENLLPYSWIPLENPQLGRRGPAVVHGKGRRRTGTSQADDTVDRKSSTRRLMPASRIVLLRHPRIRSALDGSPTNLLTS